MNWNAFIQSEFSRLGKQVDATVVEEMAQHADAAWDAARAEGQPELVATAQVRTLVTSWCAGTSGPRRLARAARVETAPADASLLSGLTFDIRYALRMLRRSPGFSLVAIITLALGIGANTAIFSLIDGIFLHGLRFERSAELVQIFNEARDRGLNGLGLSIPKFEHVRDHQTAFSALAADFVNPVTLTGQGDAQQISADQVTSNFFDLLGVEAARGRLFTPEEEFGGQPVAVLSAEVWADKFQRDPEVLGRSLVLNGVSHLVIGIVPPQPAALFREVDLWTPRPLDYPGDQADLRARGFSYLRLIGRLKSGVAMEQARQQLSALTTSYREANAAKADAGWDLAAANLEEYVLSGGLQSTLWMLLGAVGMVLAIAISNVANLLLVRFSARRSEIAMRLALGADRLRVVRLFLAESVIVSVGAALLGIGVARAGLQLLLFLNPPLPVGRTIVLSWPVLAFTAGLALLTGVVMGLYPAFQAARADVVTVLNEGGRGSTVSRSQQWFRMTLVGGQVAISFVLLAGALLLLSSVMRLQRQETGFAPASVLLGRLNLTPPRYATKSRQGEFTDRLLEDLRSRPGIKNAAMAIGVPLTRANIMGPYSRTGDKFVEPAKRPMSPMRSVSSGYFDTLGIPLLAGRVFTEQDTATSPRVIILSQATAERLFPEGGALGGQLIVGVSSQLAAVVGIVGTVRSQSLWGPTNIEIYRPLSQRPGDAGGQQLIVKTAGDPMNALPIVRGAIAAGDPSLALVRPSRLVDVVHDSIADQRLLMTLLATFAGVAVAIAVVGIYSVLAFLTGQRRGEIGLRLALGADRLAVVGLILRQGLTPVLAGLVVGAIGMFWAGRLLENMLFSTRPLDPTTYAIAIAVLLTAAGTACLLPARRAAGIEPVIALRN